MFEHLFHQKEEISILEKFDTALTQLDNILGENDKLLSLFLRSTLYLRLGESGMGKKLAIELLEKSRTMNNKVREFDALNNLILAHRLDGNISEALDLARKEEKIIGSLLEGQKIETLRMKASFYYQMGRLYYITNNPNPAYEYYEKAFNLSEQINDVEQKVRCLGSMGYLYLSKGELDRALDYFKSSLPLLEGVGNQQIPADILNGIGVTNVARGEMDTALEFFTGSLRKFESIGSQFNISRLLNNIGQAHSMMGEFDSGKRHLEHALQVSRNIHEYAMRVEILYNTIKFYVKDLSLEEREEIHKEMKESNELRFIAISDQKVRLARAMILKTSERLMDKTKAQTIFREIAEEPILWHELTIDALLNLGELLVFELKATGNEDVFKELKQVISRLLSVAKLQSSHWLMTEIYLLQSRLSLLELDIENAEKLLTQAEVLSQEKGLKKLAYAISLEKKALKRNLDKWKKISEMEPSLSDRIELTQFNTMFERMILKKLYRTEEELKRYVNSAQQIVEDWEKK
ncbi:MAG: tetratricopeptide repeat protein [Candidatus Heimdallarchaeota archaeon]